MDPTGFSVDEFRAHLMAKRLVAAGDLLGCSDAEIADLMRVQQVTRVPSLYRDFLRVMGRRPYPLMTGTDWSYEDLLVIKGSFRELLAEDDADPALLDDALVIALHQGYVVYYIPGVGTAPDDPGVWTYVEGEQPTNPWPTFRAFLLSLADMRRSALGTYETLATDGRFTMLRVDEVD